MSKHKEQLVVNGQLAQQGKSFMAMVGRQKHRHAVFKCACGQSVVMRVFAVKSGHSLSCGCAKAGKSGKATHGHTKTRHNKTIASHTYNVWSCMKSRCLRKANDNYEFYGGRGITVCDRWKTFTNFLSDVGEIPEGMSLDRIDSNGHYEPENVRLIPFRLQARNTRSNRIIEIDGVQKSLVEWVEEIGVVEYSAVHARLCRGWEAVAALTTPAKKRGLRV